MAITASDHLDPAIISIESLDVGEPDETLKGLLTQRTAKAIILGTDRHIPSAAEVRVQTKDLLFLGEVQSSVRGSGLNWRVLVQVKRAFLVV